MRAPGEGGYAPASWADYGGGRTSCEAAPWRILWSDDADAVAGSNQPVRAGREPKTDAGVGCPHPENRRWDGPFAQHHRVVARAINVSPH
jgi:hypothetical protein